MPADEAQLIAADELSVRGWMYHKRLRTWLLQAPSGSAPGAAQPVKTARGERGSFLVFNPAAWEVGGMSDQARRWGCGGDEL
jgi:CCR4-NOT transcription complex subunit 2